jgi:hypothetical protein
MTKQELLAVIAKYEKHEPKLPHYGVGRALLKLTK